MMDNAADSLRAGALQPAEPVRHLSLRLCMHALKWHIESAYSVNFEAVRLEMF